MIQRNTVRKQIIDSILAESLEPGCALISEVRLSCFQREKDRPVSEMTSSYAGSFGRTLTRNYHTYYGKPPTILVLKHLYLVLVEKGWIKLGFPADCLEFYYAGGGTFAVSVKHPSGHRFNTAPIKYGGHTEFVFSKEVTTAVANQSILRLGKKVTFKGTEWEDADPARSSPLKYY